MHTNLWHLSYVNMDEWEFLGGRKEGNSQFVIRNEGRFCETGKCFEVNVMLFKRNAKIWIESGLALVTGMPSMKLVANIVFRGTVWCH